MNSRQRRRNQHQERMQAVRQRKAEKQFRYRLGTPVPEFMKEFIDSMAPKVK